MVPPYERGVKAVNAGRWRRASDCSSRPSPSTREPGRTSTSRGSSAPTTFPFAFLTIACFRAGQFDKARAYLERARAIRCRARSPPASTSSNRSWTDCASPSPSGDKPVVDRRRPTSHPPRNCPERKPAVVEKPAAGDKTPPPGRLTSVEKPVTGKTTEPAPAAASGAPRSRWFSRRWRRRRPRSTRAVYPDAVVRAKEALARNPGNATATAIQRSAESRILVAEGLAAGVPRSLQRSRSEVRGGRHTRPGQLGRRHAPGAEPNLLRQGAAGSGRRAAGQHGRREDRADEAASLERRPRFEREGLGRRLDAVVAALGEAKPEAPRRRRPASEPPRPTHFGRRLRASPSAETAPWPSRCCDAPSSRPPRRPTPSRTFTCAPYRRGGLVRLAALSSSDPEESRRLRERGAVEVRGGVLEVSPRLHPADRLISPRVLGLLKPPPAGR